MFATKFPLCKVIDSLSFIRNNKKRTTRIVIQKGVDGHVFSTDKIASSRGTMMKWSSNIGLSIFEQWHVSTLDYALYYHLIVAELFLRAALLTEPPGSAEECLAISAL